MSHLFTIQVSGIDLSRDYEGTLYGAGCDDALIAVVDDALYLDFDREAPSFEHAVDSAKRDVELAGGRVIRVMQTPERPSFKAAAYLKEPYARLIIPETDGTFRGEILEFPGCIATGDNPAETLKSLEDVASSWLQAALANNQPIPKPEGEE